LAKENTFLQQYNPEFISQESPLFQEFAKDTVVEVCYKKIMDRKQAELIKLDQYAKKNKLKATFKQLIRNDIEYYHYYLFDKLAGNFYWQQYRSQENNIFDNQQWGAKWKAVIQPITTHELALVAKSTWYSDMISPFDNFPMWVYCYDMNVKPEEMNEVGRQEGLFPQRLEKQLNNLFKGKLLELHLAIFIRSQAIQHSYEKYLIPMFDRFKQQFPQSEYLDWLNQEIELVRQFQTTQNKELSNKIKIIDKYQEIKQLADLLTQFKGKTVVIDLWGTWCGPCKDEFKHTTELKNYFKDKPIEYLYIAYERKSEEMEKYWLKMIKYHNLEGYHLIGNEVLHTDIWQQVSKISDEELNNLTGSDKEEMEFVKNSKGEGKVFPNYLIVDKNGNIVFKSAFKPSEKEKLYKQIEQVLNY
jgi:thiol-disulfide isomerase/thioredoxin